MALDSQLVPINNGRSFVPSLVLNTSETNISVPTPSTSANTSALVFLTFDSRGMDSVSLPLKVEALALMIEQSASANVAALPRGVSDQRVEIHIVAKKISLTIFLIGLVSLFFWEASGFVLINPLISTVICAASVLFYVMGVLTPILR